MQRLSIFLGHFFAFALVAGAMTVSANAKTLTFDSMPVLDLSPAPQSYREVGYEVSPVGGGDFGSYGLGGIHFDICCGPYTSTVALARVGGGLFSLLSLDLRPLDPLGELPVSEHFASFTGYRGGSVVGLVSAGYAERGTLGFGSGFSVLDRLVIGTLFPPSADISRNDYHFDVDNIVVSDIAPVPLPAAAWMLFSALGGLASIAFLRRRS